MTSSITRKRPASAISTSGLDPVQEIKNYNRNSSSPRAMENPSQTWMHSTQTPTQGLSAYADSPDPYNASLNDVPYFNSQQPQQPAENLGTELVRAQTNNQIVSIPNYNDGYHVARPDFVGPQPVADNTYPGQSQHDDLDHRALLAERDAQSKRKQIPPFVQKLSSFLNENTRNTDLIRWSDSGDSFIVLDEDEFAKTLIPELFKHNNYASFVRQLNMYGFHKKVGLSDNSMRASERKNKNPSEYSNPYFKRGKPNLLWLIHKPKNGPSKGGGKGNTRAKQEDAEEEADDFLPRESPAPPVLEHVEEGQNHWSGRQPLALPPIEGKLPPEQFKCLQQEMAEIRLQQRKITEMLNAARRENVQIYNQAKAFHELHEKHDNSINAILTFLASVYKNNMHDKGLDFRNMFGPNTLPAKEEGHEIISVTDDSPNPITNAARPQFTKKKPLLLKDKASPPHEDSPKAINQWPASAFPYPDKPKRPRFHSPAIQEISDQSLPHRGLQSPQTDPGKVQDDQQLEPSVSEESVPPSDILSVIQKQNAQNNKMNGTQMEFPEALSQLQSTDGQAPLTASQRQNMLRLMSNEQANTPADANYNNALTSYNPPDPAATLAHFSMNSEQLSQIERSLKDQEARMASMQATIAPLSPSGSIPGVNDQTYNNGNSELDLDSIFNTGDYFNDGTDPNNFDFTNGAEFPDFDFGVGGENTNGGAQEQGVPQFDGMDEGRVKEMDSSEATSPANTVQTIDEEDHPEQKPRKLRKRN